MLQKGYDSLGVRFVNCPHCQKQHNKDINAAINIRNEGLRLVVSQYGLGETPSELTGELVRALGTSASALGGYVRPQSSGRKKSMNTEEIPNKLGSLHCTARSV
jgi:putative transposase